MPVNTPQVQMPVYQQPEQQQQMAVPPQPEGVPSQMLPTQAGYVSKGGAAAYVANNLLQGWLKGREIKQQQNLSKAQNQLSGADYTYQAMSQNYNDLLRQGKPETDPDVQKAKQAAVQAWQAKLNVMQQYAMPDQEKKPKGAKQKTENWFSHTFGKAGLTPEMIPQASLQILRSAQPPGLGLTPQDKQAMSAADASAAEVKTLGIQGQEATLRLQSEQQQQAFKDALAVPVEQRTPQQRSLVDSMGRVNDAMLKMSDPEKWYTSQVMTSLDSGKALSPEQRNWAYQHGLLMAPHLEITSQGLDQYATLFSPDGKVMSQQKVGRTFHEDEAAAAVRIMRAQNNEIYDETAQSLGIQPGGKRGNPHVWSIVTTESSKNPMLMASMLGGNPLMQEQDMILTDSVLRGMQSEQSVHTGDPTADQEATQQNKSIWSNFLVTPSNDPNGFYSLRNPKAEENGNFAGGLNDQQLRDQHAKFIQRFRAELMKKKPEWTPLQIQEYMQRVTPPQAGQQGQQSMAAPPGAAAGDQMTPPPSRVVGEAGQGKQLYNVMTDQGMAQAWLTPDGLKQVQSAGYQITPANQQDSRMFAPPVVY